MLCFGLKTNDVHRSNPVSCDFYFSNKKKISLIQRVK